MIELHVGDLRLRLDPETGGAIAGFTYRGAELLRPVIDPRLAAQRGRAVAGYPLVPYANRIGWGRFSFEGQDYQLARNFGDSPHTIHGNGWMRPWTTAESGPDRARLTLDHTPPQDPAEQWPFAYRAELVFTLHADVLRITLSVENRDTRAWPAGLGLHPYVARATDTTLRFEADTIWITGEDGLPKDREAVRDDREFAEGRLLAETEIDSCYAGWNRVAAVGMPDSGVTLVMTADPPLDHLQVYTPRGRDFLGLEPVSNMPNAANLMDTVADAGLQILKPGEILQAELTLGIHRSEE